VGDLTAGQTVAVIYTVKIKSSGTLGNASLNNYVLAADSTSCDPQIAAGKATVSNPDCQTSNPVNGLANTGVNVWTATASAFVLIATSIIIFINRPNSRGMAK